MKMPCWEDVDLAVRVLRSHGHDRVALWIEREEWKRRIAAAARKQGCTVGYYKKHFMADRPKP